MEKNFSVDPRVFWNNKIIEWETQRYEEANNEISFIEKLATKFSGVANRLNNAKDILLPHVKGKSIIELGCGSGLLAEILVEAGAAHYQGIDISDKAIEKAQERVNEKGLRNHISFTANNINLLEPLKGDLVFSLGFLDWLTLDEIQAAFRSCEAEHFLHSFSEKQFSFWQFIHKMYVYFAYGHQTKNYIPRYYSIEQIKAISSKIYPMMTNEYRNKNMRFVCFHTNLPIVKT